MFDSFFLLLAEGTSWSDFRIDLAEMVVKASVTSQDLCGRAQTSLTKLGQLLTPY